MDSSEAWFRRRNKVVALRRDGSCFRQPIERFAAVNYGKSLARMAAFLLFSLLIPAARAQYTTGTLQGTVFDASGSVIAGATVTLRSLDTNETKNFTAGADGIYYFAALLPGCYEVSATAKAFSRVLAQITVYASQTVTQNLNVPLQSHSTQVMVVAASSTVTDTSDPQLSTTYGAQENDDLPTSRSISNLTALAPGVQPMYSPSGGGLVKVGGAQTGLISANGGRPENTNVEFDYTDAYDWEFGGFALGTQPQPDMTEEFKVLASNVPAEYGIKSNGEVEMISKAGGNRLHGQTYEYLQNNYFNARDFFDTTGKATRIDENNYGFSAGGPVIKDKTFLFGGFQQNKTIGGGFTDLANVPTPAAIATVTDPGVLNLIHTYFPAPTAATSNPLVGTVAAQFSAPANNYQFLLRGDHHLTDRNSIAIRYFQGTGTFVLPFPNFNTLAGFDADLHYESRNANISDTWDISPSTVNQVRFAYARSLGLLPPENNLQTPRFDILDGSLASFGALEFFTQGRIFNVYQGNDVVSHEMGRHQLKFGFDARYIQDNSVNQTNDRGLYLFQTESSFLNAQPALLTQAFGPTELGFREHLYSAFAQDDYRIRPTLTINIGLRWEYQGSVDESHGLTSVLDPSRSGTVGVAGTGPLGSFYVGNPAIQSNPANFAPRVGFAWNPNAGRLVARGGYGIYYDTFNFTALSEARTNPPTNYTFNLTDFSGANNFDALLAGTAPFIVDSRQQVGSFGNLTNFGTITTVNRDMRNPYVQQWDLLFDYQLARSTVASIGYVGAQGTHLQAFIPINPIAPANRPAPATSVADEQARIGQFEAAVDDEDGPGNNRVDPRFDQVNIVTDAASSTFHSLQINLRTTLRYGLTLQAAYSYSKSIDDSSSSNPNQESFDPGVQQDVHDLALERGPSNYDIPNRIVVTGVWALPFGKDHPSQLANLLIKGWTFSSINTWQSGIPANIYAGPVTVPGAPPIADVNIDGVLTPAGADNTRANCNAGGATFQLGNPASLAAQTRYTQPLLGNDGTCGRNRFRLNSLSAFNWAFSKDFRLTERGLMGSGPWSIQFRAEVYNVFNHPDPTVSGAGSLTLTTPPNPNPSFGLYNTAGSPRTMQLALKLLF
jgi:hypothetical protein